MNELLIKARSRFDKALDFERENRELAAEDLCFIAGEQWPDEIKHQREIENKPCLTINKLPNSIDQVVNDARQNKPAIKVSPDEDGDVEIAEIYEGLIRNIESRSSAPTAYLTSLAHSVSCGFGHFRIVTEYSNDMSFDQDIRIKRIANPFSVVWDPASVEYDRTDAQYCFVYEDMTKEAFEAAYPDAVPDSWDADSYRRQCGNWMYDDKVRVAEYWEKKPVTKKLAQLDDGRVIDVTGFKSGELKEIPQIRSVRDAESFEVCVTKMNGAEILEETQSWAGSYIPIISVYGPEETLESGIRYRSLIRYAKDPQRMYNFWTTQIAEKIALAPKSPYIGTTKMFAKHKKIWDNANTSNRAYLPYTPDESAPGMKPMREQPAALNVAEIEQRNQASDDIKATTGIYDASLGNASNETSGRAILARERQGDVGTFAWIDNLSRSIEKCGKILLDLIPRIYDTQRVVRVLGADDSVQMIPINQAFMTEDGQITVFDLSQGKYDVTIAVGPSYTTQRIEAADSMMAYANAFPEYRQYIADMVARNMDWPQADDIADRIKNLLPPQVTGEQEEVDPMALQAQQEQMALQMEQVVTGIEKDKASAMDEMASARKKNAEADEQEIKNILLQAGVM